MAQKTKKEARKIRHYRVRNKISGTSETPRVNIFKSNLHFYAQIIDDNEGKTLASSSTLQLKLSGSNIENATKVAKDLAKKAKAANVDKIVFDRSGYIYHGKVKAFADALREEGIKF